MQKDHFPLPFIDQVLDTLAGKKYFSFPDGFSGYNQIQISLEDQDKTTFTCPWGTFAYRVLPFGLCNAPATFQREILGIFFDLINDSVEIYMDNFTPYGDSFRVGLENLEKVLARCIQACISLSTVKCHMMMEEGIILGHLLSDEGIRMDPAKIQVILHFQTPKTVTQEFLVVVYDINKFRHYITKYPTFVHTDHATIRYLMKKPVTPSRIRRWLLLLQEFDITIVDKPGKDNVVTDFLSRIECDGEKTPIEDDFLDEHLFAVFANAPWYVDIANYLATGKVPRHLSYKKQRKIIHHSIKYSWMAGYLFHMGVDRQIQRCVAGDDIFEILKAAHGRPCGGHFADKRTRHKVLQMGYYWPSIFYDAQDYMRRCDSYQWMGQPGKADEMPLQP
eukprot:PITA_26011